MQIGKTERFGEKQLFYQSPTHTGKSGEGRNQGNHQAHKSNRKRSQIQKSSKKKKKTVKAGTRLLGTGNLRTETKGNTRKAG